MNVSGMRLELAEKLICPAMHEATPLIVVSHETIERDLRRADLGCMVCRRQGELREGSVRLVAADAGRTPEAAAVVHASPRVDDDSVLRLAALLGLNEPGVSVLLGAQFAPFAPVLAERHDAIVAVHGAAGASPAGVGYVVVSEGRVPFASGSFAAAALDASMPAATIADALRCVRVGGRVVGELALPLPAGVRALARDAEGWVGELVVAASPIIPLRRA